MSDLIIDKVSMRFDLPSGDSVQALEDINLCIEAGEIMAVLGPSGCGKTTLLNIVAGFLAPTAGTVSLAGTPVTEPGAERGMVFQQGALFEWMSVRENVAFGPSMKKMPKAEIDLIVDHLLEVVGLGDFKEKAIYELSGGMQQRVALARCLANDPQVILMDEPLGPSMRSRARRCRGSFSSSGTRRRRRSSSSPTRSRRPCCSARGSSSWRLGPGEFTPSTGFPSQPSGSGPIFARSSGTTNSDPGAKRSSP